MAVVERAFDAVGPTAGAAQHDHRAARGVGDGQLVQRAAAAADHHQGVTASRGQEVAHRAQARWKDHVEVRIARRLIHQGQEADGQAAGLLRALRGGLHHPAQAPGDHHPASLGDKTSNVPGGLHGGLADRSLVRMHAFADNADGGLHAESPVGRGSSRTPVRALRVSMRRAASRRSAAIRPCRPGCSTQNDAETTP